MRVFLELLELRDPLSVSFRTNLRQRIKDESICHKEPSIERLIYRLSFLSKLQTKPDISNSEMAYSAEKVSEMFVAYVKFLSNNSNRVHLRKYINVLSDLGSLISNHLKCLSVTLESNRMSISDLNNQISLLIHFNSSFNLLHIVYTKVVSIYLQEITKALVEGSINKHLLHPFFLSDEVYYLKKGRVIEADGLVKEFFSNYVSSIYNPSLIRFELGEVGTDNITVIFDEGLTQPYMELQILKECNLTKINQINAKYQLITTTTSV